MEYKEKLWLGTDGGLIIYNPKDESYEYCPLHVPRSVTNNEVKYIQKEGDHLLWISIYYCGLYLYDMETRRIIKEIPDFPYNQVRRIAKGTDNIYWIALGVDSPILRYHMENNHRTFYHQCTRFKSYRTLYMDGDSCSRSISLSHTDS